MLNGSASSMPNCFDCFNSTSYVPSVKSHFMVIVIMKGKAWLTVRLIIKRYVKREEGVNFLNKLITSKKTVIVMSLI